jgi:simple sugar transport system ATP-binding protein
MTGRELSQSGYDHSPVSEKAVLQVENLSQKHSFSNICFKLYPHEIVGITGLLGSGRTELALALFGANPFDSGKIYMNDKPVKNVDIREAMANGIAYVPEDRLGLGIFADQSIERNIVITVLKSFVNRIFIKNKKAGKFAEQWQKSLNITAPSLQSPIINLSGGNQQKCLLARWLATRAKLIIFNSPTVGVDIGSKMDIHKKIKELGKQGKAILIISDDLPELLTTCNRILIMHKGRIVDAFDVKDIDEDQLTARLNQNTTDPEG